MSATVSESSPATESRKTSRFPLFVVGAVELVLVCIAGVLVLISAIGQAMVSAVQRYGSVYAGRHGLAPAFPEVRAKVAELLVAAPVEPAAARTSKTSGAKRGGPKGASA